MANKIRTVFSAEEGSLTYADGMVRHEDFKSKSDALCYLIALGMQAHNQKRIDKAVKGAADANA